MSSTLQPTHSRSLAVGHTGASDLEIAHTWFTQAILRLRTCGLRNLEIPRLCGTYIYTLCIGWINRIYIEVFRLLVKLRICHVQSSLLQTNHYLHCYTSQVSVNRKLLHVPCPQAPPNLGTRLVLLYQPLVKWNGNQCHHLKICAECAIWKMPRSYSTDLRWCVGMAVLLPGKEFWVLMK